MSFFTGTSFTVLLLYPNIAAVIAIICCPIAGVMGYVALMRQLKP
jgi:hypothetical protein